VTGWSRSRGHALDDPLEARIVPQVVEDRQVRGQAGREHLISA
jgi:hypothetical protein